MKSIKIVEISALNNGGHRNQEGCFISIPDGWAVIPDQMQTENFPFGEVEASEIEGVMTVTKWTAGEIPQEDVSSEDITIDDVINTLLGVTDNE